MHPYGMEGVDLRAVMASSPEGGEEAAMAGSMSAFILTLMCLNDEEWEGTAAMLGSAPEERENLQCVLEKMGGPEGFAETLGAGEKAHSSPCSGRQRSAECRWGPTRRLDWA